MFEQIKSRFRLHPAPGGRPVHPCDPAIARFYCRFTLDASEIPTNRDQSIRANTSAATSLTSRGRARGFSYLVYVEIRQNIPEFREIKTTPCQIELEADLRIFPGVPTRMSKTAKCICCVYRNKLTAEHQCTPIMSNPSLSSSPFSFACRCFAKSRKRNKSELSNSCLGAYALT